MATDQASFCHGSLWKPGQTQPSEPHGWHFVWDQNGVRLGRMLPKDFPKWKTVYGHFRRLCHIDIWERVLHELLKVRRLQLGSNEHHSMTPLSIFILIAYMLLLSFG